MKNASRTLVLFSICAYLFAVFVLYRAILIKTGGRFVYAMDDPYIHLALAENLAHGHYGINPTEFASPSSSILWPFLLVPFTGTELNSFLPLLWNILFGVLAAGLIGHLVAGLPLRVEESEPMPWWQKAIAVILLLFAANLFSLTILGMEHVLQVLLAICCALGLLEALAERPVPQWCLAAAVVAPAVRYEDFALTLAVCVVLAGAGKWTRAATVLGLSLIPVVAFSAFLKSKGLPLLPLSVLVKGDAYQSGSLPMKLLHLVTSSVISALTEPERYPMVIFFLVFAGLTWTASTVMRRYVFGAAFALAGVQLLIGRFGWFHRYEIYAVIFLVLIWLAVVAERPRQMVGAFWMALAFCSSLSIYFTAHTAGAAKEIFSQHYQVHRFVTDYYHGDYAVGDLGYASYQRRPGAYVLDVFGLGSLEAARQPNKSAAWLHGIVERHGVRLAILNPKWFAVPPSWTPQAKMCLPHAPIVAAEQCVVFYSTVDMNEAEAAALHSELEQFAAGLPANTDLTFSEPCSDGSWRFQIMPNHL